MTIQRDRSQAQPSYAPGSSASDDPAGAGCDESKVAALQRELDALRAAHHEELERLRAETFAQLATLYAALDEARAALASRPAISGAATVALPGVANGGETPETPQTAHEERDERHVGGESPGTSRRALLKWGGLAAAAGLAAAGGSAVSTPTALANDGGSVVLGQSNNAEHVTNLTYDGSDSNPVVFRATTGAANSTAVVGSAGGGTSSFGVVGSAGTNGTGVQGVANGASAYGVYGTTDSGYAVVGIASTGIDLAAIGSGRLWQKPTSFTGAPTSGTYFTGEQIRDSAGNLFICIAGGSPGVWKQVLTLDSSFHGGMIGFLSTPIRVYDTRPINSPLSGNEARNVAVSGVSIGGIQVPKGSVGCIGNLTVYHPTSGGYLVIYPAGSPTPSSSTVNFGTGQTIPNSFAVGLSGSGQVTVHAFQSGNCHIIVDITGFVS